MLRGRRGWRGTAPGRAAGCAGARAAGRAWAAAFRLERHGAHPKAHGRNVFSNDVLPPAKVSHFLGDRFPHTRTIPSATTIGGMLRTASLLTAAINAEGAVDEVAAVDCSDPVLRNLIRVESL